jgi:hypothetical protein
MVILEGNNAAKTFTLFQSPPDTNMAYSFHDYAWFTSGTLQGRLSALDKVASAQKVPMWNGEFGQDSYSTIAQYVAAFKNDPLISGWTLWTWKSVEKSSVQVAKNTPNAQKLMKWLSNPLFNAKPSQSSAEQGMQEFINNVQYKNTSQDYQMLKALSLK